MKFVYFNIMCLFVWSYCDACELNGEECTCDYLVYLTLKIRCLKKSNLEKVLTFEPFPYYENKYILNIELTIQNKVYIGIEKLNIFQKYPLKQILLHITNNKIERIQAFTFSFLTNLTRLELNNNDLVELEINSFDGLKNLNNLTLHSNKIKYIKNGVFKSLLALKELWLHRNEIISIENNSFSDLVNLQILYLHSNKLDTVKKEMFGNMSSLKELWLQNNQIKYIDMYSFSYLHGLQVLNLYTNRIKQIENGTFGVLKNLIKLALFENEIETIELDSFGELVNLKELSLNTNKLKSVKKGLLNNMTSIQTLYLHKMELNYLDKHTFGDLNALTCLNLDENLIDTIKSDIFVNLDKLQSLHLAWNYLNLIEKSSFKNLKSLNYLNMSHNYIDGLVDVFEGLDNLNVLDLSFNYIKVFEHRSFFSLRELYFSSNFIQNKDLNLFKFESLKNFEVLHLDDNELSFIENANIFEQNNLKCLFLNRNLFKSLISIKLMNLQHLELLDVSENAIESVNENDFNFSFRLNSINLNNNPIKYIHYAAFEHLNMITTFKIANTHLTVFNVSLLKNSRALTNLDISLNIISIDLNVSDTFLKNVRFICLNKIRGVNPNVFLALFLNVENIEELDFSGNYFSSNFSKFGKSMTKFELRSVNLQSTKQIHLMNLSSLTYLDLSYNNLTFMDFESFECLTRLKFLDLSNNRISFVDSKIFSTINDSSQKPLEYLNLENNRIFTFGDSFINYNNLHTFKISNNYLIEFQPFKITYRGQYELKANEFYFNFNKITTIRAISYAIRSLSILNLDSNEISVIERDALFVLKALENLSISKNNLTQITKNNFFNQFKLKYLDLSYNFIETIESDSFINLDNLLSLDLSYNPLISIDNNIFKGLSRLNDLYLLNNVMFTIKRQSFNHLSNINNLYLNETLVIENQCIFMHSIDRIIQRNVRNGKMIFFKSINLISSHSLYYSNLPYYCELAFNFLQFKIHFNLKTDYENELFYEKCKSIITERKNYFKYNYLKCFPDFVIIDKLQSSKTMNQNSSLSIISDYIFILTMLALVVLLVPVILTIVFDLIRYF